MVAHLRVLAAIWAFVAMGENGFHVYDIANIDNKDFSERIVSAPVSPIGQRTFVKTKFASAVALPTTMPVDPSRKTALIPENQETPMHPLYRYAYIADREEGLIMVDVTTLIRYAEEGCRRLSVLFWQDGVQLGQGVPAKRQTVEFGINYCRTGMPPRSLEKAVQP